MVEVSHVVAQKEEIRVHGCFEDLWGCWGTGGTTLGLEELDDGEG